MKKYTGIAWAFVFSIQLSLCWALVWMFAQFLGDAWNTQMGLFLLFFILTSAGFSHFHFEFWDWVSEKGGE